MSATIANSNKKFDFFRWFGIISDSTVDGQFGLTNGVGPRATSTYLFLLEDRDNRRDREARDILRFRNTELSTNYSMIKE